MKGHHFIMQNSHEKTRQTWILVLASLASFMVSLDALVVVTALTTIHQDLGVSIEALEWTLNAYTLSFAVLLIPAAALGDRFGRRRMFVAGLLLFVGASAACALAHNIGWLIAARTIQGCGAALVLPLALTLLSAAFRAFRAPPSGWYGDWCAGTAPAGAALRSSQRLWPVGCSPSSSLPGNCVLARQWCQCTSSALAPSLQATRRSSCRPRRWSVSSS